MSDDYNYIGLKNFYTLSNGYSPRFKIRTLREELKYAWQRAWRGYDDIDVWDIFERFRNRMIITLQDFLKTHHGLFWVPKQSEHYNDLGHLDNVSGLRVFNEEETNIIIETMIYHLKMMDEDYVEKILFGSNIHDKDYDSSKRTRNDWRIIGVVRNQNKDNFMKLFNLFYWDLWD